MPSKRSRKPVSKKSAARKGSKKASKKASKRSKKTCAYKRVSSYEGTCDAGMMWRRGYCKPSSGKYVRGSCVRMPKPYTGPYLMTPQGQVVVPQGQVMKQESVVMTPQGPVVMEQVKAEMPVAEEIPVDVFDTQMKLAVIRRQIQEQTDARKDIADRLRMINLNAKSFEDLADKAEQQGELKLKDDYEKRIEEISAETASLMKQQFDFTAAINQLKQQEAALAPLSEIYLYY